MFLAIKLHVVHSCNESWQFWANQHCWLLSVKPQASMNTTRNAHQAPGLSGVEAVSYVKTQVKVEEAQLRKFWP